MEFGCVAVAGGEKSVSQHLMAEAKRRAVLLTIYKKPLYTSLL